MSSDTFLKLHDTSLVYINADAKPKFLDSTSELLPEALEESKNDDPRSSLVSKKRTGSRPVYSASFHALQSCPSCSRRHRCPSSPYVCTTVQLSVHEHHSEYEFHELACSLWQPLCHVVGRSDLNGCTVYFKLLMQHPTWRSQGWPQNGVQKP